jgi:hypothetical protein
MQVSDGILFFSFPLSFPPAHTLLFVSFFFVRNCCALLLLLLLSLRVFLRPRPAFVCSLPTSFLQVRESAVCSRSPRLTASGNPLPSGGCSRRTTAELIYLFIIIFCLRLVFLFSSLDHSNFLNFLNFFFNFLMLLQNWQSSTRTY